METLTQGPVYEDINITVNYESNPNYDPEGFSWLYSITKNFMDLILVEAIPENVIKVDGENKIDVELDGHVSNILTQYAYVIVICLLIVIFAMTMLSAGLFSSFNCCCRFQPTSHDEKKSTYKKYCLIILMIVCGAFITFGGVFALLANERLQDGLKDLPEDIRKSVRDTEKFLNAANEQIDILVIDNFDQFNQWIDNDIQDCSNKVLVGFDEIVTKMSVDNIFVFGDKFVEIRNNVKEIIDSIEKTRSLASSIKTIGDELKEALQTCGSGIKDCTALIVNIGILDVNVPDNPSLKQIFENIWYIPNKIAEAKVQFDRTKIEIMDTIDSSRKQAEARIANTGTAINESISEISSEIKTLNEYLPNTQSYSDDNYNFLDKIQDFVNNYDVYMHYINVAMCYVLFFIVGLLAIGISCSFSEKNFVNQGGWLFLICGKTLVYIIAIAIAAVTLIYFLIGIIAQQGLCKSLRGPFNSPFFEQIDDVDLSKYGLNTTISNIVGSIRDDKTAYNAFNLRSNFDVDDVDQYLDDFEIALKEMEFLTTKTNMKNFQIMTKDEISSLKSIEEPNMSSINVFKSEMKMITQSGIIDDISLKLDNILKLDLSKIKDLETKLKKCKADLTNQMDEIKKAATIISNMEKVVNALENELKLGYDTFDNAKNDLIEKIDQAQLTLKTDGPVMIDKSVQKLITESPSICSGYLNRVKEGIKNEVGLCGPLEVAVDATITSICDKTVSQINIIWFIFMWVMMIFFPTAIVSTKLATLYKSTILQKPPELKRGGNQVTNMSKRGKLKRTEENSVLPDIWYESVKNDIVSGDSMPSTAMYKPRKLNSSGRISELSSISNGNNDMIFNNDILLDSSKWELYPPPQQSHNSRTLEGYTRPPSYFSIEGTSVQSSGSSKPKKPTKVKGNSELSSISYGNTYSMSDNDISLDKWEQYPPPSSSHHLNDKEEYKRPPAYYLPDKITRLRHVRAPQGNQKDILDDLSKWTQYPLRNSFGDPTQSKDRKLWL